MTIYTEEFMALKIAVGVLADRIEELDDREKMFLRSAEYAIEEADARLTEHNAKQAAYMKQRRERRTA